MKTFKKDDRQLLEMFSDTSLIIDDVFKNRLRARLQDRHAARPGDAKIISTRRRFGWPKFVLAPAFGALVVALLIGFNINKLGDVAHPLTSRKVSAAELVNKSNDFKKSFDPSKYDFFVSRSTMHGGPYYAACAAGIGDNALDTSSATWVYKAPDGGVEALYTTTTVDGKTTIGDMVYDKTSKVVLPSYVVPAIKSLSDVLRSESVGVVNNSSYYNLVNSDGTTLKQRDFTTSQQNGRDVYVLYAKLNTSLVSPLTCKAEGSTWTDKEDTNYGKMVVKQDISKIVIDAKNFQIIAYNTYVGSVAPVNLIAANSFEISFSNVTTTEALRLMMAAGFDKATASPAMPAGHD